MLQKPVAIIFDMDGVIIDSEPFWRIAALETFESFGLRLSEEECKTTTGLRTKEVVKYWMPNESEKTQKIAEKLILKKVVNLIHENGKPAFGFDELIGFLRRKKNKIGLATSSPKVVIEAVKLKCFNSNPFETIQSAENLPFGKPHPQVYLNAMKQLNSLPQNTIAIEDSLNGIISAKAAKMGVITIPNKEDFTDERFSIADYKIQHLEDVIDIIGKLS